MTECRSEAISSIIWSWYRIKFKNCLNHELHLMFICPSCGKKDTFVSEGNQIRCKECEATYTYDEDGMLQDASYKWSSY